MPVLAAIDTNKNRLVGSAGPAPDIFYDAAGNMTSVGLHPFVGTPVRVATYDALNMQSTFRRLENNGAPAEDFLYIYGPGNVRLLVWDGVALKRHFTFRDLNAKPLREMEVTGFGAGAVWTHLKDFLHGPSGLIATRAATGIIKYFHHDHLGTPRLLTSASGSTLAQLHYYPYGAQANLPSSQDEPGYKFTGHERDRHGATDYMLGRTYAYPFQRFMQVDPARDGWNLYGYVKGNPVNLVDPDGLADKRSADDIALLEDPDVLRANALIIANTGLDGPLKDRVEFGTVVTKEGDGDFGTTPVTTSGSQLYVNFALKRSGDELVTPEGEEIAATIHSHVGTGRTDPANPLSRRLVGGRSSGACTKNGCSGDKGLAVETGAPVYILNAFDSLVKYDPKVGKDEIILSGKDYDAYVQRARETP